MLSACLVMAICGVLAVLVAAHETRGAERVVWVIALVVIYAGLFYWGCV